MKQKIYALILLTGLTLFSSCYPDGADYVDETDIVYTVYDTGTDFQGKGTYAIPDKIYKITGAIESGEEPEFIDPIYAQPILATIENNMTANGWTKVDKEANPDVTLFPAAWSTTYIFYWYDYWCYWDPYYCGGWWYPYPVTTSYTAGTLVMNMVDPNAQDTNGTRKAVWTCAINGLMTGSYNKARIDNAINQAFKQSPYLKTN